MGIQKTINKDLQFKNNPRNITGSQIERLEGDLHKYGDLSGVVYCQNNKAYVGGNQRSKIFDGAEIKIIKKYKQAQPDKTVAFGFIDWNGNKYLYREVQFTKEEFREACIVANNDGGSFDWDILSTEWDSVTLTSYGLNISEYEHLFPSDLDYSSKNKEIDIESFNNKMKLKLEFEKEEYDFVLSKLNDENNTREQILLKLLCYE